MITLVVGHRGVGKTSLLERVQVYAQSHGKPTQIFDLDAEIEKAFGQSVTEIFNREGEARYRQMEQEWLHRLVNRAKAWQSTWISVGAGYQGTWPNGTEVLWLRRPTDKNGRIFLNRPPLNPDMAPLKEYFTRYEVREQRYPRWTHRQYMLSEGFLNPTPWEAQILGFQDDALPVGGVVTLREADFRSPVQIPRLMKLGVAHLEIRDDLLNEEQVHLAKDIVPGPIAIYSLRAKTKRPADWAAVLTDWALELPGVPSFEPGILSRHERKGHMAQSLDNWPHHSGAILKLAVEVEDFEELRMGHDWWKQDPARRCFLPRSKDGRWQWYRLLFGPQMPLAFWRESEGSALDQPTLMDWLRTPKNWDQFAAVLGWPVTHSHTPAEQQYFFQERNQPVVAIGLPLEQWTSFTLQFLKELGLNAAAITSPLKEKTAEILKTHQMTSTAVELNAVNTLAWQRDDWRGHNTDLEGFRSLRDAVPAGAVAIWGGGGTRQMMRGLLPEAAFCSIRTQEVLASELKAQQLAPETVVWAVGRNRFQESEYWPPSSWQPRLVVDLNYSEDSPGLEYALKCGARYVNGMRMFKTQAQAQRKFWQEAHDG